MDSTGGAMVGRKRSGPPRFKVGDLVRISSSIATRFNRKKGVIVAAQVSPRSPQLDQYIVRFGDGHEVTFWDIQLKSTT
jgi:hypothetical protein